MAVYLALAALCLCGLFGCSEAFAFDGFATYYDRASCDREGTGGPGILMANGQPLDDEAMTCAVWGRPFGMKLMVYCPKTNRSVIVTVTDRGPGKEPMRRGVVIDLSKRAFLELGVPLDEGKVEVNVMPILE